MPKKPDKDIINAAKKNLDPIATLSVVLNQPECAELKKALIEAGLVEEIKEK
jgi:hypothetical protein